MHVSIMTEIVKGKLYLGNVYDANDLSFLEANNIDTIITVAHHCNISNAIKTTRRVFQYDIVDFFDEDILKYFGELTNLIETEKCVLVHCVAGISRSATIVLAYLMTTYNMTLLEAFRFVKTRRPIINPNGSFIKQLIVYEYMLYGENSVSPNELVYKKQLGLSS